MTHFWKYFVGIFSVAATVVSCGDDDTTGFTDKEWSELTAPQLTLSAAEVVLEETLADQTALTFTWTAAEKTRTAGVTYELYINRADADIFAGVKREAGSDLTLSFTHKELNDLLGSAFGAASGERFSLNACVYAKVDDYLVKEAASAEAAFAVTVYAASVVKPESLWMKGGACEQGWDGAVELPKGEEGVYTAENVVLKFGKPADNKGFKFYVEENGSYPFYGQRLDGDFGQIQTFASANDGDSQFYPLLSSYVSGIYTVKVDLNAMQLTLTKTGDVTEFDPDTALYILGDNMANGWDMVEANALLPVGDKIYEHKSIYIKTNSSFKFDFHDWTEYIRDASASDYWTVRKKVDGDGDIRFEAAAQGLSEGNYTVRVDLNTMKVTLTPVAAPVYPEALFLFGPATEAGWDLNSSIAMTKVRSGVFEVKSVRIDVGTANPDDNKGNGFKFGISNTDWSDEYGAKEAFDDNAGQEGYRGWGLAKTGNQFYPLLMGCESGVYNITVDFTTMTVMFQSATSNYPAALYILGDAMPNGWDLGNAVVMNKTSDGVFVAENVAVNVGMANPDDNKGNGFKFIISNTDWLDEYGAKEAFDDNAGQEGYRGWELVPGSNQFYPLLMGFSNGNYRIKADLTTMTVLFEAM